MAAVVGALRAILSLDSAAFLRGAKAAQSGLGKLQASMEKTGAVMQEAGQSLSLAISAPVAGLMAASKAAADSLVELRNQAGLANMSAQSFKTLALAADEFGINQDKLSDILKDVNDRVGDFMQTGGGPMKDFFEKIAPQVGVTAEQFRGLSGADALQLYVSTLERAGVSQADMVFYMEAMAGDAARLIPIFLNNGAAIKEMEARARALGLTIDEDLIESAAEARRDFNLLSAVLGIQLQQALVKLAPAFQQLLQSMVPAIQGAAQGLSSMARAFSSLSPETQKIVVGFIGIAAAIGPVLMGAGMLVAGLAPVIGALKAVAVLALANPIGAIAAAAAAAAVLIYQNWEPIKAFFSGFWSVLEEMAEAAWKKISGFASWAVTSTINFWTGVAEIFAAIMSNINAAFVDGWEAIKAEVSTWPARFIQFGYDIVEGLKRGILERWDAMVASITGKGEEMMDKFKSLFGIASPSKVFRGYGRNITEGLALGIGDQAPMVDQAMAGIGDGIDQGGNSLQSRLQSLRSTFENAFVGMVTGAMTFKDALRQVASQLAQMAAQSAFQQIFGSLFGGGGGSLLGSIFGFAKGGAFNGGRVMAFAKGGVVAGATAFAMQGGLGVMGEAGPEAIMPLSRGADGKLGVKAEGGGQFHVTVAMDPSTASLQAFVRDEAGRVVASSAPSIAGAAVQQVIALNRESRVLG